MTSPRSSPPSCLPPGWLPFAPSPSVAGASSEQLDFRGDPIGVPPSMGSLQGTPQTLSTPFQAPSGLSSVAYTRCGSGYPPVQGSSGGSRSKLPGLLRQAVRRPEVLGRNEACAGFIIPQPLPSPLAFPYGDPIVYQGFDSQRRLRCVDRSSGRLLSYTHPSASSEVAQIFLGGARVPVQGSTVRPGSSSMDLFQSCPGALFCPSPPRSPHQGVPRRLADTRVQVNRLQPSCAVGSVVVQQTRLHPKLQQVGASPVPRVHVPGNPLRHRGLDCLPIATKNSSSANITFSPSGSTSSYSLNSSVSSRIDGVPLTGPTTRPSSQETISASIPSPMVASSSALASQDSARPLVQGVCGSVDELSLASGGGPSHSPPTPGVPIYGRLDQGLGCSHGPPLGIRHVASLPASLAHQSTRIGGCGPGSKRVSSSGKGQARLNSHRQHDRPVLPEQTGGGTLSFSVSDGRESPALVPRTEDHLDSQTHFRQAERFSGSSEQSTYDPAHRVDLRQECPPSSLGNLVHSAGGPLRNKIQLSSSSLCLPSPRPRGMGGRRSKHSLEESPRLRLSPHSSDRKSPQESSRRKGNPDTRRPLLAGASLVSRADVPFPCPTPEASHRSKVPAPAKVGGRSRQPKRIGPTRMATVREALSALGASTNTQEMVLLQHRAGTSNVYTSAWGKWSLWCGSNEVNPHNPLPVQFANYLSYLFKVRKLSASTVKVHRAAISSTMRQLGGPSFSEEPLLSAVVRSAILQEAKGTRRAPAWDLFLVLKDLRSHPYEPLHLIPLPLLTRKTAFLLMLASGRRGSEVHSLSGTEVHIESDGSYSLNFLPGFLAKNQRPEDFSPKVMIKPLTHILCDDDEDRFLCPVRALKEYRRRTASLRSSQRGLLLSLREGRTKDISRSSLARWIKQVITEAYNRAGVPLAGVNPRPHEVRALSTSVAFLNDCSLKSILDAAYWRSNGVFIDHYLRSTARLLSEDSWGIGSVVVAQQALSAQPRQRRRRHHKKN